MLTATRFSTGLRWAAALLVAVAGLANAAATPAVGLSQIPATEQDGTIKLYHPSSSEARSVQRGPFNFRLAEQGNLVRGNGRLVVV